LHAGLAEPAHTAALLHASLRVQMLLSLQGSFECLFWSGGQVIDVPSQLSVASHPPAMACRQVNPLTRAEQVPTLPVRLQAPQPPAQAELQQTPSVQNPEPHSFEVPQATPALFLRTQLPPTPVQ
jgi:hypothetical protein